MTHFPKGDSPFHPGKPVPVELFVGRREQIERILSRGAGPVSRGNPKTVFIQGEYGIGKTSLAHYIQWQAELNYGLQPIYVTLGGASTLDDVAAAVLTSVTKAAVSSQSIWNRAKDIVAKYVIMEKSILGFRLNLEALKSDALNIVSPLALLTFLESFAQTIKTPSICLVFDEINGIASLREFSGLIKGLVESNAVSPKPFQLLLVLCGTEEIRNEMTSNYVSVARIYDLIVINTLSNEETIEFFNESYAKVNIGVSSDALSILQNTSAGIPRIMHLIGDHTFWADEDGYIDKEDALKGCLAATEEWGQKYVHKRVYQALKSKDYHAILKKMMQFPMTDDTIDITEFQKQLSSNEKSKLSNFLTRMKKIGVIERGRHKGEYAFRSKIERLYLWLKSRE
ncbi:MAG: ATP-binding protein [Calditrichaeota bacterium]|nr:ATP-binding protein [Calditrichota bacterium]